MTASRIISISASVAVVAGILLIILVLYRTLVILPFPANIILAVFGLSLTVCILVVLYDTTVSNSVKR